MKIFWLGSLVLCSFICPGAAHAQEYDMVLRNGLILDGTGKPAQIGDVAIKDQKIAAVGRNPISLHLKRGLNLYGKVSARQGSREGSGRGRYVWRSGPG